MSSSTLTNSTVMYYFILCFTSSFLVLAQDNLNNSEFKQLYEELPTPNVYRTASGAPGHEYYQQKADYIILKPAQHSLDDISLIRSNMYIPVGLYQVSDEYRGLPSLQHQIELCQVYRRAGANFLVTYGARDIKEHWKNA